ncbi:hypothetical protein BASA50_010278 [Batrachochytrium salamandrivorans]|uniref:YbaK/aminoacyl-tRNA synthetase-associated domain-containing protein n=1 Tax=Batrachochytrium salamandrivorans TaxID=1357716 RepID=A0ABQ8F038_9FUNG|nr:hypothetical protein BASA62_007160 [Batrachochytrium salamandrivorans]KAH6572074.1 hypothetical protein BASA60_006846 [Batrachochytrium salamandrivorans]KAH6586336.1 hypothetical protein BASA61_006565 [Batrachochytrium salamandrivorans]KAH6589112.1 hypothetical protein BASA50_010278 [Batrachochytrium salamandrivorans]KAH9253788.1 hypothetical protein BASA81_008222 [Batrachochytrium salamandrivorans]
MNKAPMQDKVISKEHQQQLLERIEAVAKRLAATYAHPAIAHLLLQDFYLGAAETPNHHTTDFDEWPIQVQQVAQVLTEQGLNTRTLIHRVDPAYYSWPLHQRATVVSAYTPSHMCKSVIFENTKWTRETHGSSSSSRSGQSISPRYITVIVQYTSKLNTTKLNSYAATLLNPMRLSRKMFHLRVAPEETAMAMTGFGRNGICPFGMLCGDLPTVITLAIHDIRPAVIVLGAGHVDWKLSVSVADLTDKLHAAVVDLE